MKIESFDQDLKNAVFLLGKVVGHLGSIDHKLEEFSKSHDLLKQDHETTKTRIGVFEKNKEFSKGMIFIVVLMGGATGGFITLLATILSMKDDLTGMFN